MGTWVKLPFIDALGDSTANPEWAWKEVDGGLWALREPNLSCGWVVVSDPIPHLDWGGSALTFHGWYNGYPGWSGSHGGDGWAVRYWNCIGWVLARGNGASAPIRWQDWNETDGTFWVGDWYYTLDISILAGTGRRGRLVGQTVSASGVGRLDGQSATLTWKWPRLEHSGGRVSGESAADSPAGVYSSPADGWTGESSVILGVPCFTVPGGTAKLSLDGVRCGAAQKQNGVWRIGSTGAHSAWLECSGDLAQAVAGDTFSFSVQTGADWDADEDGPAPSAQSWSCSGLSAAGTPVDIWSADLPRWL